jgi:hypothetical protein
VLEVWELEDWDQVDCADFAILCVLGSEAFAKSKAQVAVQVRAIGSGEEESNFLLNIALCPDGERGEYIERCEDDGVVEGDDVVKEVVVLLGEIST